MTARPYKPSGMAREVVEFMRDKPERRVWTSVEIAEEMGISTGQVGTALWFPCVHHLVYRAGGKRYGLRWSLQPFPPGELEDGKPKPSDVVKAPSDPREDYRYILSRTKLESAPQMVCHRPGTDPLPRRHGGVKC